MAVGRVGDDPLPLQDEPSHQIVGCLGLVGVARDDGAGEHFRERVLNADQLLFGLPLATASPAQGFTVVPAASSEQSGKFNCSFNSRSTCSNRSGSTSASTFANVCRIGGLRVNPSKCHISAPCSSSQCKTGRIPRNPYNVHKPRPPAWRRTDDAFRIAREDQGPARETPASPRRAKPSLQIPLNPPNQKRQDVLDSPDSLKFFRIVRYTSIKANSPAVSKLDRSLFPIADSAIMRPIN